MMLDREKLAKMIGELVLSNLELRDQVSALSELVKKGANNEHSTVGGCGVGENPQPALPRE